MSNLFRCGGGKKITYETLTFKTETRHPAYNFVFDMTQIEDYDKIVSIMVGNAYSKATVAITGAETTELYYYGARVVEYVPGATIATLNMNAPRCSTQIPVTFDMLVVKEF